MRLKTAAAAAFAVLLIVAATVWVTAQALEVKPVPHKVLTGADVGFRVEGIRGGNTPVGTLVVKVNGEWVEVDVAKFSPRSLRP
jgi:hypothetical protein